MASPLAEAIIAISVDQTAMRSQLRSVRNYVSEQARLMAASLAAVGSGLVLKGGMEYENRLNSLRAILTGTNDPARNLTADLEALRQKTIELGTTTMFSASEAAEAMRHFAQLGFNASQTLEAIPDVLNLAAAGQLNLAEATEFTGQVLRQFNLTTAETARVADVLTFVSNKTSTDVRKLALGLSYVGSEAHALGQSFEEAAAAIGILSNAGQTGSRAGTGLRVLLTQLAKADVAGKFKEFGIEIKDATNNMRPLNEIVNEFNAKTSHLSNVAKQAFLSKIFTIRGATATLGLLAQGQQKIVELADAAEAANGYSNTVRKIMESGVVGSFRMMRAAVATALDDLVTRFAAVGLAFGMVRNAAAWFARLPDDTKDMVASFIQVAAAVALVNVALPRLIGFLGLFTSVVTGPMNASFKAVFALVRVFRLLETAVAAVYAGPITSLATYIVKMTKHYYSQIGAINTTIVMLLKLASTLAMVAGPFGFLANQILSFALFAAQAIPLFVGIQNVLGPLPRLLKDAAAWAGRMADQFSLWVSSGRAVAAVNRAVVASLAGLRDGLAGAVRLVGSLAGGFLGLGSVNRFARAIYQMGTAVVRNSAALGFLGSALSQAVRGFLAIVPQATRMGIVLASVQRVVFRLSAAFAGFHRLAGTIGPIRALSQSFAYLNASVKPALISMLRNFRVVLGTTIKPAWLLRGALAAVALSFSGLGVVIPAAKVLALGYALFRAAGGMTTLKNAWIGLKGAAVAFGAVNAVALRSARIGLRSLGSAIHTAAEAYAMAMLGAFAAIGRGIGSLSFGGAVRSLNRFVTNFENMVARGIVSAWRGVISVLRTPWAAPIGNAIRWLGSQIKAGAQAALGAGVAGAKALGRAYLYLEANAGRAVRAILRVGAAIAVASARRALSGLGMAVTTVVPIVLSGFRALGTGIISAVGGAFNLLTQLPALVASGLTSLVPGLIGLAGAAFAAVNPITVLAVALGAVAAFITGGFVVALLGLAAGFAGALKDPKYADDLKNTLQELLGLVRGILGDIIGLDQGMDIWASLKATAVETMKAIRDWVKENRDTIVDFGRRVYAVWWMAFGKAREIIGVVWEYIKSVFGQIQTFVMARTEVFRYWGVKIVQITMNAFNAVKDIVLGVVGWIVRQWQVVADATGITWDGVLETITGILERIAYWTNDLGKTWDYVMKSMALSSSESADEWADTWADIKGLADGTWSALVAGADAATSNILRLFEGLGDGIAAVADGMIAALKAGMDPLSGTSPQQAFKTAFATAMAATTARPAQDVGERMADAFAQGILRHPRTGESPLTRQLRAELAALKADMDKLDAERKAAAEIRMREIEAALGGKGNLPNFPGKQAAEEEPGTEMNRTFKYEFVGIPDLAKKIQEGLQPSTEKKQAADQAKAIMDVNKNIKVLPGKLDKMIDGIDRLNDNQGAVFA